MISQEDVEKDLQKLHTQASQLQSQLEATLGAIRYIELRLLAEIPPESAPVEGSTI